MKLALLLLIIGGWFYLRRKFKKKDGPSFPWVDWFLGIMISLYSLIVVFMLFGVEQKRAGMLAIGITFFGALITSVGCGGESNPEKDASLNFVVQPIDF